MPNPFLQNLKLSYPKSWTELELLSQEVLKSISNSSELKTEDLPFDLAFGLLLRFFKENELEFDYNNLATNQYETEIENIFANFELVIGHYS